jgi:hypothetical protein
MSWVQKHWEPHYIKDAEAKIQTIVGLLSYSQRLLI